MPLGKNLASYKINSENSFAFENSGLPLSILRARPLLEELIKKF